MILIIISEELNLLETVVGNHKMYEEYCLSESVNFQQHKKKSDFSTYFGR